MNLIDIHAHLNFRDYDADREEVIVRTVAAGCGVINVGADLQSSREVVALTKHQNFWATVGVHPDGIEKMTDADWQELKTLVQNEKVVAIGECGLDFFKKDKAEALKTQTPGFIQQIELAQKVGKPLMLHIREAYNEVIAILKTYPGVRGNAHFFAGNLAEARAFLDLGFTLSFTGVVTFRPKADQPRAGDYDEVIKFCPIDRIMAETDSPFVAPVPYRGKRNEPLYVAEVVKRIAEIKGISVAECQKICLDNARQAFNLLI